MLEAQPLIRYCFLLFKSLKIVLQVHSINISTEELYLHRFYGIIGNGKVAEWFNASVLKTDVVARLPRVRLPLFP